MHISISKKFSGKERAIVTHALKVARMDMQFEGLRSIKIGPLGKSERETCGGYATVWKKRATVKIARSDDYKFFMSTVFHELTHISQFARGDLKDYKLFVLWRGWLPYPQILVNFSTSKWNPFYHLSPWEREARKYETKIMAEIGTTGG